MKVQTKAFLAALCVYTLWGFSFLASQTAQKYVSPIVLLACRFDLAALLMLTPVLCGKQKLRLRGKNLKLLLLLGLLEPCIYFIGEQYGLKYTNSAFSGVMIAVIPVVTLIIAAIFIRERPTVLQWVFSCLSILGIILITVTENKGGGITAAGVGWLIVAIVSAAAYTTLNRKVSDDFTVFERTFTMQLLGAVFFTALALVENFGKPNPLAGVFLHPDFLIALLFLSAFCSVLAYTCFNYAISHAPIAKVIVLCNLTTVISVVAGVVLLGDPFSPISAVAMIAVLVGIWGVQKY